MKTFTFEQLETNGKINVIKNISEKLLPLHWEVNIFIEWENKLKKLGFLNPKCYYKLIKTTNCEATFTFDGLEINNKCIDWLLSGTNQYKKIIGNSFSFIHANTVKTFDDFEINIVFRMKWQNLPLLFDDGIQELIEDKIESNIKLFHIGISEKITNELNLEITKLINNETISAYLKNNPQLIFDSEGNEINIGYYKFSKLIGKNFKLQARDSENLPLKTLLTPTEINLTIPKNKIYTIDFIASPLLDIDSFELNEEQLNQLLSGNQIEFIDFDFQQIKGTLTPLFIN